ncbi:MAG TPA: type I-U CRISPR-associated protein Csb2 [Polyangiaceae bacterium]|nr:type I-U CRISPR-associated protein Csb2 [Polyangiaceae bacterium]
MATLKLRFPGGRYHATSTGYHVNEGTIEWPPSPWRLIRALIACGYTTQRWGELTKDARHLFESLSSVLPEYALPEAALGHSRHYMPTAALDKGRERTTLVLDTFADVADGELWVRWPVQLGAEEAALFSTLAEHLGYLGRSESWVLAEVAPDDAPMPGHARAFPHREGERAGRGYEQVSLLAPELPGDYASWRKRELQRAYGALEDLESGQRKFSKAQLKKRQLQLEASYPLDVLDGMQWDTARWKDAGWSQAPASRRVLYWRDTGALEVAPPPMRHPARPATVEALLFALTTPSGSRSALPTVARTVPQADLFHKALVSKSGRACPELSGRADDGTPLRGHEHAHVLPLDLDHDGRLDHILLFTPCKLSPAALTAARAVKRTYMKGGLGELQVAIAGEGNLRDLCALEGRLGESMAALLGPSRRWVSVTPFVPPRFLKKRGPNSLEGQVGAELAVRGLSGASVEVLPWAPDTHHLRHVIRRRRKGAPQPPMDLGFIVRLHFDEPIHGPICLGYGSHFGLGRFDADG